MAESSAEPSAKDEGSDTFLPKHTIFLSHSGAEKPFVEQLCVDLERAHYYPFFDKRRDSLPIAEKFKPMIEEAASKCLVAVVVLSPSFLTSKWPMKELITFVKAAKIPSYRDTIKHCSFEKMSGKPSLKILPLFFKMGPHEIPCGDHDLEKHWGELVMKEALGRGLPEETLISEGERSLDGFITKEQYFEAIKKLKSINGLPMKSLTEVEFREEAVSEIMKHVPRQLPIDTTGLQGHKRLCEDIKGMFCERNGPGGVVRKYLGLYGKVGVGKTTICCEAMIQYFQGHFHGRYCRVYLPEGDSAPEAKSSEKRCPDGKKRQERIKLAIQQLVGWPPTLMSNVMTELELRMYLTMRLKDIQQPVFLVVDNVTKTSQEEARWYANLAELPPDSFVLVTSRCQENLKSVLGGSQYCRRFPALQETEALELFWSNASPLGKPLPTTATELEILLKCVRRCCIDDQFIPRSLKTLALFLRTKGDILCWKDYDFGDVDSILGLEYDNLDDTSKHIFLDLAYFAREMCFTHLDFHGELKWDEHINFKHVVDFIAMLHGIPFDAAERKVKGLQNSSFLKESNKRISASEDYLEFANSVIHDRAEIRNWCMVCSPDDDRDYVPGMVRVALRNLMLDLDNMSRWKSVRFLDLYNVWNLSTLDLRFLRALRVLWVKKCGALEEIVSSCRSISNGLSCYEKEHGCLVELRVVQLEYLPKLRDASFAMHSSKLETLWFYECPDVSSFPDLRLCRKLKRLRLPCGDFKGFQSLQANRELMELAFHWETDTVRNFTEEMRKNLLHDVMNLTNLTVLDIVDEHEVYDWIPPGIHLNLSRLVHLTFLDLSCATTIREVEGLEQLSELTSLGLYGCCELRKLPNFRKLKRLCIGHCHKLDWSKPESSVVEAFHALGESCALGFHKCLDPYSPIECPNSAQDVPKVATDLKEEEAHPIICRVCNEEDWKEKYLAKDPEEPGKNVNVSPAPAPEKKPKDNSLNILLLGESGVGKSTFINSLCNYLKFSTLDEARRGEMQTPIYSEFTTPNEDGTETKVVIGTPDDDEGACTKACKEYTFGELRLVDSPGIGDSRGFDHDEKNIKEILSFVSRYDFLSAICILLKPNEESLNVSLRYCIMELLTHLHKDASRNILFCFTNSRSTMFRVGSSKCLLTEVLSQSPQTAAINLGNDSLYHFDNEGFRFLASVKSGLGFSEYEMDIVRSSWKRSAAEAARLLHHVGSLKPHDIQSTLSLNCVRGMLATIETPLAEISAAIQNNLDENRKAMKELLGSQSNISSKYENFVMKKEEVHETIPLGHMRTLCNSSSCHGRICHYRCSPNETIAGGVLGSFTKDPHLFCANLSLRKGRCRICNCPNDAHVRVSQERRKVVRESEDGSVRKIYEAVVPELQKVKAISAVYKKRERAYKREMQVVVEAAALFAAFLQQNSIITYHAATQEYLKEQLKKKRHGADRHLPSMQVQIAELEGLLETYQKQVQSFKNRSASGIGGVNRITEEDVREEMKKLYALPQNGKSLKLLMEDVERENKCSVTPDRPRINEVAGPPPCPAGSPPSPVGLPPSPAGPPPSPAGPPPALFLNLGGHFRNFEFNFGIRDPKLD